MKVYVYVVTENWFERYEGGDGSVSSVHSTFEKAFAKVKLTFPDAVMNDASEWYWPNSGYCEERWLAIEKHEVE